MFATCCQNSMNQHTERFHEAKYKRKNAVRKNFPLPKPLYCVCGFTSSCGNKMGELDEFAITRGHVFVANRCFSKSTQLIIWYNVSVKLRTWMRKKRRNIRRKCSRRVFRPWSKWTTAMAVLRTLRTNGCRRTRKNRSRRMRMKRNELHWVRTANRKCCGRMRAILSLIFGL